MRWSQVNSSILKQNRYISPWYFHVTYIQYGLLLMRNSKESRAHRIRFPTHPFRQNIPALTHNDKNLYQWIDRSVGGSPLDHSLWLAALQSISSRLNYIYVGYSYIENMTADLSYTHVIFSTCPRSDYFQTVLFDLKNSTWLIFTQHPLRSHERTLYTFSVSLSLLLLLSAM